MLNAWIKLIKTMRDNQILSKVQVVESVSEFTKLHKHEQRPIDQ